MRCAVISGKPRKQALGKLKQNWKPTAKLKQKTGVEVLSFFLLILASFSSTLADSMQDGSPELESAPSKLEVGVARQGRDLLEEQQVPASNPWTPSKGAQVRKASTLDVIKPSNIRKRNFSASLVQSVDQEERWQGIPDPSKNKIKEVEEKKTVVNEDIKGER